MRKVGRGSPVAPATPHLHAPLLSNATLDRSIRVLGSPASLDPLFRRLASGLPITLGVLGASVGQNAGCLDQPGKRCMGYSGIGHRPKGWAVLDDALRPRAAERLRSAVAAAAFKQHKFVYDSQTYAKPGVAEADLAEDFGDAALADALRGLAGALAPALHATCGIYSGDAAIKLQRNTSGAFPCHYDNAGPPSKRSVTAVLYLGRADGEAVEADDGGALCLAPFLRRRVRLRPLLNRLVLFKSDRVVHSVERWRGAAARLCVSFWFDGEVNGELTLTRDRLRFSDWDAAAEFFSTSPLQRCLSRAVYDEAYVASIGAMRSDGEEAMLVGHERVVATTVASLRPLVEELRRRRSLVGPGLEL